MITFHNKKSVKDKYINRVKMHRKRDEIVQGVSWEDGKGCAIGCTLEKYDHSLYPIELGIPEWLARLEDHIFEELPNKDAMLWPEQILSAIPVGVTEARIAKVRDGFQIWWLERQKTQIDCIKFAKVSEAIDGTVRLLRAAIDGDEPESAAWSAAESAAGSAAESAAGSAAGSAAWSAARSAAWSAARSAAESAAGSAAWSAAESAAEIEAIAKRDWLLTALRKLKPTTKKGS